MVKFKYLFLFLVVIFISFAKNIEEIEDMTINIEERLSLNGDIKKTMKKLQKYIFETREQQLRNSQISSSKIFGCVLRIRRFASHHRYLNSRK